MKKLVSESIQEFREKKLNEAGFFSKALGAIKKFIKKIGNLFVLESPEGEVQPVMLPVNTGMLVKQGDLPFVSYVASQEDVSMQPSLSSETDQKLIAKYKAMEKEAKVNEAEVPLKHPNKNMKNVDRSSLYRMIRMALKNPQGVPLMIWGAPGIGKTQIVEEMVKAKGAGRVVDVQTSKMAPDDWSLPYVKKLNAEGTEVDAVDLPKNWLPVYIPTGDPEKDKAADEALGKGVVFLDELSRANEAVQNTCLKLVNQRIIGDARIGSQWVVISASNRTVDDPDTLPQWSSALGNRFKQINYVPKYEEWKEWAVGKVDERILDFLEFNQNLFYTLDDETTMDSAFASPRSWKAASDAIKELEQDAKEEGYRVTASLIEEEVSSQVGMDVGLEVGKFFRIMERFSKADVEKVFTEPDKAALPGKAGSGYDLSEGSAFLSLVISSSKGKELSPKEMENFAKYLVRLDNGSLATNAFKMMFNVHPYMNKELGEVEGHNKYEPAYKIFADKYGELF
jgi:MoxR-like ATPase